MDGFIQFVGRVFHGLFSNVGKKLQILAYVFIGLSFLGVCFSMLFDLYNFFYAFEFLGFVLYAIVFISSLILSWIIYGFGQLLEDIHQLTIKQDDHTSDFSDLPQL